MKAKKPKDPESRWTKEAMAQRLFGTQVVKAVKAEAEKKQKPQPPKPE